MQSMNEEDRPRHLHRRYSDEERAACVAALTANRGNLSKTARICGVPRKTLAGWAAQKANELPSGVAKLRHQKKNDLAQLFETLAERMLSVANRKAQEMSGKDAVIAAAVAVDKMLLLRKQPTSINRELDEMSDDDIDRELQELEKEEA
jgi:transposase-like protein